MGIPSSGALLFDVKNTSYLVVSKSPAALGGYFPGLPLPLFGCPSSSSGCLVFLWLFRAGWLRKAFPQSQAKTLPSCSCFERRCLSIKKLKKLFKKINNYLYLYLPQI